MTTRTLTRPLAALAENVTSIVRGDAPAIDTARLVADALAPVLADPDLLLPEQQEADVECYRQHVLHVDPDGRFSVVALVWLPGQETCIHDHVSWCVVGVHQGAEASTLYRLVDDGTREPYLTVTGDMVDGEGMTSYFVPPGDIHKVRNSTDRKVISIHVYGADVDRLGSSIRRRYELPIR
jgi:3-mercaptopropionate dioxygenase